MQTLATRPPTRSAPTVEADDLLNIGICPDPEDRFAVLRVRRGWPGRSVTARQIVEAVLGLTTAIVNDPRTFAEAVCRSYRQGTVLRLTWGRDGLEVHDV